MALQVVQVMQDVMGLQAPVPVPATLLREVIPVVAPLRKVMLALAAFVLPMVKEHKEQEGRAVLLRAEQAVI